MKCTRCKGDMESQTIKFCIPNAIPPMVIENVPAYVCDTCGEEVFTEATSQEFARIRRGDVRNFALRIMKVFDFQKLDDPVIRPEFYSVDAYYSPFLDAFGTGGAFVIAKPSESALPYA